MLGKVIQQPVKLIFSKVFAGTNSMVARYSPRVVYAF
jgi:hypothetical protein